MDEERRNEEDNPSQLPKKARVDDTWMLEYGFYITGNRPQCLLCETQLPESSRRTDHLKRHLVNAHPDEKNQPEDYFLRKYNTLHASNKVEDFSYMAADLGTYRSYMLALRLGRANNPRRIVANEFVLECAIEIIEAALGAEAGRMLRSVPVNNRKMLDLIQDLGTDIFEQILEKIRCSEFFSIHITESKDLSYFLICGRYFDGDCIKENLLFSKSLPESGMEDQLYNTFASAINGWNLKWDKCVSICINKLRTPPENFTSFMNRIKSLVPNANLVGIPRLEDRWTQNPFINENCVCAVLPVNELRALTSLAFETELNKVFRSYTSQNIHKFWKKLPGRYTELSEAALKSLITFVKPDTCEFALSRLTAVRYRLQDDLIVGKVLMVNVNQSINPNILKLANSKIAKQKIT